MADILAQHDLGGEPFVYKLLEEFDHLRLPRALKWREAHPEEVSLHRCTATHDLAPVFDARI